MVETYYHGGPPGLAPGDFILPASETGLKNTNGQNSKGVLRAKYRSDRVFITPDLKFAMFFAGMHSSGAGVVYRVEPVGDVETDPHWGHIDKGRADYGETKQCERARIVEIPDIPADLLDSVRGLMKPVPTPVRHETTSQTQKRIDRKAFEKSQRRQHQKSRRR